MNGHQLAMALRVAYLTMHRRTDAITSSLGVTADQFVVLAALARQEAISQKELAGRTASDANTLRAMLILLEGRGLVERTPHPSDGRAWCVSITAQGRRLFRKLWNRTDALRQEMLGQMTPDNVDALVNLLGELTASINGEPIAGPRAVAESADS